MGGRTVRLVATTMLMVALGACGTSENDQPAAADESNVVAEPAAVIADLLRDQGLSSIATAVEGIDMAAVAGVEDYTFFAPSDEAFRDVEADDLAALLSDPEALGELLANHTVAERLDAAALAGRSSVETVSGATHEVLMDDGSVTIAGATLAATDLDAGGAVVHVIDGLIAP